MNDRRHALSRRTFIVLVSIVLGALVAPIATYVYIFGSSITDNHSRWAEMGSAMSGIYAPLLAVLTLVVLAAQYNLQRAFNTHSRDRDYVEDARADIHFYLDHLRQALQRPTESGEAVGVLLIRHFAYGSTEAVQSDEFQKSAELFNREFPEAVRLWSCVCPILMGLSTQQHFPYNTNYQTAKQKAIALLAFEGCVALDNLCWAATAGQLNFSHKFSASTPPPRAI